MSLVLLFSGSVTSLSVQNVTQTQPVSGVVLVLNVFDARPRIIGRSVVPLDMATW